MKIRLLGAAATAAFAISACTGGDDYDDAVTTETAKVETETAPVVVADAPESGLPAPTPDYDTSTDTVAMSDPATGTTGAPGTAGTAGMEPEQSPMLGSVQEMPVVTVAIAEIRSRTDAERIAQDAFSQADTNGDGELSREEYMAFATGVDRARTEMTPTGTLTQNDIDQSLGESGQVDEASVNTAFEDAAGADDTLTLAKFREVMMQRFETADADNNNQLDEQERQTFAGLITGGESSVQ